MGLVSLMVLLFSGFFIAYAISRQDAFLTAAEDMGNMDQAVWSIIHGQILHQTICNVVSDTNCYSAAGFSRFAIHFEPMLFPVSLFYFIWSGPKTLLVLQTLIVASGAFPAFWLARLRLRNELAAVAIALVYLLYPAQQQATIFEFHAVTFTASLLLFTLYFMYTRRTVWLFIFAILSMACKEEIPLVIACFRPMVYHLSTTLAHWTGIGITGNWLDRSDLLGISAFQPYGTSIASITLFLSRKWAS